MHDVEEVRKEAGYVALDRTREMLLAYVDLLEAMEEYPIQGPAVPDVIAWLRQRAAEKQKARNG